MKRPKPGDKVWVWHFDGLIQIEVKSVTVLNNKTAVVWNGFLAVDYYETRFRAIEDRLKTLCSLAKDIQNLRTKMDPAWESFFSVWVDMSKSTANCLNKRHPSDRYPTKEEYTNEF